MSVLLSDDGNNAVTETSVLFSDDGNNTVTETSVLLSDDDNNAVTEMSVLLCDDGNNTVTETSVLLSGDGSLPRTTVLRCSTSASSDSAPIQEEQDNPDMPISSMENPYLKKNSCLCLLCKHKFEYDYKNVRFLSQFVSPFTGKIYDKHITGLCEGQQVAMYKEIKKAQNFAERLDALSGDFELDNSPRGKPPQKFEDGELQALLDEDSTQTQEKFAKQLQVSQGAVSLHLNSLRMTQKLSRWVPHELSKRQQKRRLVTCEGLLARHEKKSFLHRIVTSDEKWIHFSNPTRQKSWGLPGQFPKQTPRPNRFGKKAMLCVWWDQTGIAYFELLKPGKTVNTSRDEQQMQFERGFE
ncbi:SETMAR [Cordylochernes scorpioides]|uniref:SETMAR n=1 Tax=Cordylochernes scorpioides TaxID=51811 RepID=A0ABY6L5A1_9ARAC|nr:SETMAR [Cordylochernes scorpioides]